MRTGCSFTFFGQEYICTREERPGEPDFGGEFDPNTKKMSINKKYDENTFLNTIHHELLEIAVYLSACTYTRGFPDAKDMFIMDHSQLDIVSGAVCGAYEDIKKKILIKARIK